MPAEGIEADRDVLQFSWNVAGPAEADLADLWQFRQTPGLVEPAKRHLTTLEAEAFVYALATEGWIVCLSGKEV
ncbi:hypothetical protein D3C71_2208950 [compost metagenome]